MLNEIAAFTKTNPLVATMGGATAAGYAFNQIKTLPKSVWWKIREQFSVALTVYSEDQLFRQFDRWLSNNPRTKKMRKFVLAEWWDKEEGDDKYALAPGAGRHFIKHNDRWFMVHRSIEEGQLSKGGSFNPDRRKQTLTITTHGRSTAPIYELLQGVVKTQDGTSTIPVFVWNGMEAFFITRRPKRPMDTVYCDEAVKSSVVTDLRRFMASKDEYAYRGTPYRRGYMFSGPPGTGKTTMILALASLVEKPIMIINAGAVENDKELLAALNSSEDRILVIEDIDSLPASENRETAVKAKAGGDTSKAGITLSGLLNALDGVASVEGRLLFITSNKPEILDTALLRPGRIDAHYVLGPAHEKEASEMFRRFYPNANPAAFISKVRPSLPMAQAELQNILLTQPELAA